MRIVYLGTPDFAVKPLEKLIENYGDQIVAVVTNPDKPVGRKKVLTAPPVKVLAERNNIKVFQYDKIKNEGVQDLKNLCPDLMITCAFGQILSQEILDIPKLGVINIHASILPKYRGASPIHYAILNGEKVTGITIMRTDIGIDTGDIISQKSIEIGKNETCGELFDRLSVLGAELIIKTLPNILSGTANFVKQNDEDATFSKIIKKEDALIDWSNSAERIYNQIRAFNPAPIAFTYLNGEPFKIFEAEVVDAIGESGEIIKCDNKLVVACGQGAISLKRVQKAGGNAMNISEFLRGNKLQTGSKLG